MQYSLKNIVCCSLLLVCKNEEKLVALIVYSSFTQVAKRMLQKISIFTSSGSQVSQVERKRVVNTASLRV